jgi:hypothetical protein
LQWQWQWQQLLDIDKWLGLFSFTVKLVSKIMSAFCAHTIVGLANGGKLPLAAIPDSLMTAEIEGMC